MASGYPDYEGGKRRVYSTADWAADVGVDKSFTATDTSMAFEETVEASHLVPAGKTFYVVHCSFNIRANAAANANSQSLGLVYLSIDGVAGFPFLDGGNGGGSSILSPPVVVEAGQTVRLLGLCAANQDSRMNVTMSGYEV